MASTQEKWQEIANRGLQDQFDGPTRAKFDEAVKRGLITLNQQPQAGEQRDIEAIDPQPQPSEIPTSTIEAPPEPRPPFTFGESAIGLGEVGIGIATGAVGEIAGGLAGLFSIPFSGAENAGDVVRDVQESSTFQPRTEAGKQAMATTGRVIGGAVESARTPLASLSSTVALLTTGGNKAAAITEFQRVKGQPIGKTLGDDLMELGVPPSISAVATAFPEALAELIGYFGVRSAVKASPARIEKTAEDAAEQASEIKAVESGAVAEVDLLPAQRTLNPADIERQSFLAQLPETAAKARKALGFQNKQVAVSVDNYLNSLAPPEVLDFAASDFRDAAQTAIDVQRTIRRERTSPIFKQATRRQREGNLPAIDTDALQVKISAIAEQFDPDGQVATNLNKALKKIKSADGDLAKLHNAKVEIDQIIEAFGENAIGKTTKKFMTDAKVDLVDALKDQSPSYRVANEEFQRLSPPVDKISKSILGKIADISDTELKTVSKKIFDPSETSPVIVRNAKKAIEAVNPEAWDALMRAELDRRIGDVRADIGDLSNVSSVENVPAQMFNAIFGPEKKRNALYAGMNPDQKKYFKHLERSLGRASKGRPGGSQTAIRKDITRELTGGGFVQSIREFVGSPIKKGASIGEEAAFKAKRRALADVLFDSSYTKEMSEIIQLPPASTEAARRMKLLLNTALVVAPAALDATQTNENRQITGVQQ